MMFGYVFSSFSMLLAQVNPLFLAVTEFLFCCSSKHYRCSREEGVVSYAAPKQSPNLFLSARYRITHATRSDMLLKNGGTTYGNVDVTSVSVSSTSVLAPYFADTPLRQLCPIENICLLHSMCCRASFTCTRCTYILMESFSDHIDHFSLHGRAASVLIFCSQLTYSSGILQPQVQQMITTVGSDLR